MKVLIACEESQAVCIEFRKLGHEAYSCDIQECSGGHPEWHYQKDIFDVINMGWDMMIGFPPCTHLACSGAAWFDKKRADGRQQQAIEFFLALTRTNIPKWAIENPIGIMSNEYRKPDQIIQPYYFGDATRKSTCLWLKGLPKLFHSNSIDLFNDKITHVKPKIVTLKDGSTDTEWHIETWRLPADQRSKARSKTFPGIARAMAEQWGKIT